MSRGESVIQAGAFVQFGLVQDFLPHQRGRRFTTVHPHRLDLVGDPRGAAYRQPDSVLVRSHGVASFLSKTIDGLSACGHSNGILECFAFICTP
jgi:hypothetical protein